jgi:hypothetical protein
MSHERSRLRAQDTPTLVISALGFGDSGRDHRVHKRFRGCITLTARWRMNSVGRSNQIVSPSMPERLLKLAGQDGRLLMQRPRCRFPQRRIHSHNRSAT